LQLLNGGEGVTGGGGGGRGGGDYGGGSAAVLTGGDSDSGKDSWVGVDVNRRSSSRWNGGGWRHSIAVALPSAICLLLFLL